MNTLPNTKQLEQHAGLPPTGWGEVCVWHTGEHDNNLRKVKASSVLESDLQDYSEDAIELDLKVELLDYEFEN